MHKNVEWTTSNAKKMENVYLVRFDVMESLIVMMMVMINLMKTIVKVWFSKFHQFDKI